LSVADVEQATDRVGGGPLVSVVMPTFNSQNTVLRALKSVLAQTYGNIEIVIADDASRDDTRQRVESLADERVTFLESDAKTNQGPAASRNRALAVAQGKYVAFLDSDDEWLPEKLAVQVAFMGANPDCSIVVSNAEDISPEGRVVETEFDSTPPARGPDAWRVLLKYSFIETSSVMTRLALVRELGAFDTKLFVSQDQDLWIRLALRGEVGIIDKVLGRIHRVPSGHMARNVRRQTEFLLPMIEGHVKRLASRLSAREVDEILGRRYQSVGRQMFLHREYGAGLHLLLKASMRNGKWLGNIFYLCHANPLGILLKGLIRRVISIS